MACTRARWAAGGFVPQVDTSTDENGVPYAAMDREGNRVHPVFASDEGMIDDDGNALPLTCGTCREIIWSTN